jgi:hypothetical protein
LIAGRVAGPADFSRDATRRSLALRVISSSPGRAGCVILRGQKFPHESLTLSEETKASHLAGGILLLMALRMLVKKSEIPFMPATPYQLFRISPSKMVYTTGGDVDAQHFATDVKFITHYAAGIAQCLGAKTIRQVVIEDHASQTAFYFAGSPDGIGAVVNGIYTRTTHTPQELLEALKRE